MAATTSHTDSSVGGKHQLAFGTIRGVATDRSQSFEARTLGTLRALGAGINRGEL